MSRYIIDTDKLIKLEVEKGLRRTDLAKRAGISRTTLARITGKPYKAVNITTVSGLVKGLKCKMYEFLATPEKLAKDRKSTLSKIDAAIEEGDQKTADLLRKRLKVIDQILA